MDSTKPNKDAEASTFSSPFDNFLHYVPKEHEVAVRQAIYNVMAIAAFMGLVIGTYYVAIILGPFLMPLFWAILTGFVMHPYKASLSVWMRDTIQKIETSDSPSFVVCFEMGLTSCFSLCDLVGDFIFNRIKLFAILGVLFFFCLYVVQATTISFEWLQNLLSYLFSLSIVGFMENVSFYQLALFHISLITSALFLSDKNEYVFSLQVGFVILWTSTICYFLNSIWSPLISFGVIGSAIYAYTIRGQEEKSAEEEEPKVETDFRTSSAVKNLLRDFMNNFVQHDRTKKEDEPVLPPVNEEEVATDEDLDGKRRTEEVKPASSTPNIALASSVRRPEVPFSAEVIQHPGVSALRKQHLPVPAASSNKNDSLGATPSTSRSQWGGISSGGLKRHQQSYLRTPFRVHVPASAVPKTNSGIFLRGVFLSCLLVQFFTRPWLLNLLPIPILIYMVKNGIQVNFLMGVWSYLNEKVIEPVKQWALERAHILFPSPVRKCVSFYIQVEKKVVGLLPGYTDTLVTGILIVIVIFAVLLVGVFVSFELYAESMYMAKTSGKLFAKLGESFALKNENGTINLNPEYQKSIEEFLDTAYLSGRDFISSSIKDLLGHPKDPNNNNEIKSVDDIETQVLELWDRLYQYWLSRRNPEIIGPNVTDSAVSLSFDNIMNSVMEKPELNWSAVATFCKDNYQLFLNIVDQVWIILKGNIGIATSLILEVLTLIFSGSTGIVNFLLNLIIYFTALFYLLNNSGKTYKPIEVMGKYGNLFGSGFVEALDKAITSIFWLTFKMITFYSLYTYLTHSLFKASIVMVPVLAAAFLAAIPVAGQYLVPIPAALELWLSRDRPIAAILLILFHVAPTLCVDSAMYSEVRGGMHPWVTGLSIVGGIYYFGFPGTIYGPLILCAVYVVMSMYPNAIKDFQIDRTTRLDTPILKRSESIY